MKLPNGILKKLSKETGFSTQYLCNLVSIRSRPSPRRSIFLEQACNSIGLKVPKELWLFGSKDEIKAALSQNFI